MSHEDYGLRLGTGQPALPTQRQHTLAFSLPPVELPGRIQKRMTGWHPYDTNVHGSTVLTAVITYYILYIYLVFWVIVIYSIKIYFAGNGQHSRRASKTKTSKTSGSPTRKSFAPGNHHAHQRHRRSWHFGNQAIPNIHRHDPGKQGLWKGKKIRLRISIGKKWILSGLMNALHYAKQVGLES